MTLNPLANPKGVNLACEICQKPAFTQCTKCRVTYYCGSEHQTADWISIHEKICHLLRELRVPIPFMSSVEEREEKQAELVQKKKQMIETTITIGQKLLFEGRHERAIPAALQSLKFCIEVYGQSSIELVPSYLILGEASIGMGKLGQAEDYLSQAQWTVLKNPECDNATRSRLHRILGLLYATRGDYAEALNQLANDIYYSSEEFGTADVKTSGGYYHMANVFLRQNRLDVTHSLYEEVTNIWCRHLEACIKSRTRAPTVTTKIGPVIEEVQTEEVLDEAQVAEAVQVLNAIYAMREHERNRKSDSVATIAYTLAMLYFIIHDMEKAREFGRKAVSSCQDDQENARKMVEFLKVCERM